MLSRTTEPSPVDLRVRFNPYWRITSGRGCVAEAPDGFTRVRVDGRGTLVLDASFAPELAGGSGPRCSP